MNVVDQPSAPRRHDVAIPMQLGTARAFAFCTQGQPRPVVLVFMDGSGIRPALFELCQRLAAGGYYVLLPDLFWRRGPYAPVKVKEAFASESTRTALIAGIRADNKPTDFLVDMVAILEWLNGQPDARTERIAVTGYCMGGELAIRAAALFADRVVAAAAFHPSKLATAASDSPHRFASSIRAEVLVAGADFDDSFDARQREVLAQAFLTAGVTAEVVVYPDARHGYVPTDTPTYDPIAAERHWRELFALLDRTLLAGSA